MQRRPVSAWCLTVRKTSDRHAANKDREVSRRYRQIRAKNCPQLVNTDSLNGKVVFGPRTGGKMIFRLSAGMHDCTHIHAKRSVTVAIA